MKIHQLNYGDIAKTYKNPFGRTGAVCATLIFLFIFASMPYRKSVPRVTVRQGALFDAVAFAYIFMYLALMSIYYFRVARWTQVVTTAESSVYLSMYATRANRERYEKNRRVAKNGYRARSKSASSLDDNLADQVTAFTCEGESPSEQNRFTYISSHNSNKQTRTTPDSIQNDVLDISVRFIVSSKPSPRPTTPL